MGHQMAVKLIERAAALGLKGKKRDDAALDYFVGAAAGAELAGDAKLACHLGVVSAMIISVRGYIGVAELAAEAVKAA
jgi:hypothetical protein